MSEIQIQAQSFQWAWNEHPETRRCFFHVPNGGSRNKIEAAQLKASGVLAGVADMIFFWRGNAYAFEFKTPEGRQSEAQLNFMSSVVSQGVIYFIVRGFEDFKKIFKGIVAQSK